MSSEEEILNRDRIIRLEETVNHLRSEIGEVKKDVKSATEKFSEAISDFRNALTTMGYETAAKIDKPMERFTGVKLALIGLGSVVVFFFTVLGGILGAVSYFTKH